MTQQHRPSNEDLAAFLAAVDGATPLPKPNRISFEAPRPSPRPRQRERDEAAVLDELLHAPLEIDDWLDLGGADSFLRSGLPRSMLRDLRRGRWSIQDHVDLHGLNRHQAHEQVMLFIAASLAAGRRCLRIVHGRGNGLTRPGSDPAATGQGLARSLQGCSGFLPRAALRRWRWRHVGIAQGRRQAALAS